MNGNVGKSSLSDDISQWSIEKTQKALHEAKMALSNVEKKEVDTIIMQILKLVNDHQVPFDKLLKTLKQNGAIYSNSGRVNKIYVDSNNPKNLPWNRVGRTPKWLREKIEQGIDIEEYAVNVVVDDKKEISLFYNPDRPTQRWNGVGCKPMWFRELESKGIDMTQYQTIL